MKAILINMHGRVIGEVQVPKDVAVIEYQLNTYIAAHLSLVVTDVACAMFVQTQRFVVDKLDAEYRSDLGSPNQ